MQKILKNIFFFFAGMLLVSCSTTRLGPQDYFLQEEDSNYISDTVSWTQINSGSYYYCYSNPSLPLIYHCVKIQLTDPSLNIVSYPASKTETDKGINASLWTKQTKALISINTTPYKASKKLTGLAVNNRSLLSPAVPRYSALRLIKTEDNLWQAFIDQNQTERDYSDTDFAAGGFFQILKDSSEIEFSYESRQSRTAAGVSYDGKTLYLLVTERNTKSKSRGLSYPECARILKKLGACNALEFDGGGSTALFINGKSMLFKQTKRKNAAYLGFFTDN